MDAVHVSQAKEVLQVSESECFIQVVRFTVIVLLQKSEGNQLHHVSMQHKNCAFCFMNYDF